MGGFPPSTKRDRELISSLILRQSLLKLPNDTINKGLLLPFIIGIFLLTHNTSSPCFPEAGHPDGVLQLFINSVQDYAIFLLDTQGLVLSWNAGARRLKGYEDAQIIGRSFTAFYLPSDIERNHPQNELALATTTGRYEEEGWRVRQDGSCFWANVVITKLVDPEGLHIGFGKVTRDLSERREAQEKLKQSYQQLEQTVELRTRELVAAKEAAESASVTKSTFLANMSHEIRTPLGAIIGFSDLIGRADASRAEIGTYLDVVKRNSAQLLRIIDDILDLSKVEAGRMDIEQIRFSLPDVISDMASILGLRARENGIRLHFLPETKIPVHVIADPTRLRQIILNVVGNAIKFTEKGEVRMAISLTGSKLRFIVKDSGRGISDEQAQKLFQPFTQADAATNRKYGGTGLGLALTKGLCQAMGGDFYLAESRLGEGSTFVVEVEVVVTPDCEFIESLRPISETKAPTLPIEVQDLKGLRILLVEDSPDNQQLMQILLSRAGALVEVASDGQEGLAKAAAGNYDAILMDIQMPRIDGLEAVKRLRTSGYGKPIIALSAHAMKEQRESALKIGFDGYLTKPIQPRPMIDTLKRLLNLE